MYSYKLIITLITSLLLNRLMLLFGLLLSLSFIINCFCLTVDQAVEREDRKDTHNCHNVLSHS